MGDNSGHKRIDGVGKAIQRARRVRDFVSRLLVKQSNIFHDGSSDMSIVALRVILQAIDDYHQRYVEATDELWELVYGDSQAEKDVEVKQAEFEDTYLNLKISLLELIEFRGSSPAFHDTSFRSARLSRAKVPTLDTSDDDCDSKISDIRSNANVTFLQGASGGLPSLGSAQHVEKEAQVRQEKSTNIGLLERDSGTNIGT